MTLTLRGIPISLNSDTIPQECDSRAGVVAMGAAMRVTRADFTAAELRAASARCTDGAQVRHIPALALVLEGRARSEAAALNGMDWQTLSDWVHRSNADGLDEPMSRKSPGREPILTAAQKAELRKLVIQGPDPAVHKVVHHRVRLTVDRPKGRCRLRTKPPRSIGLPPQRDH